MIIKCVRGDYFPGLVDYIMRRGQYAASGENPRVLACEGLFSPITAAAELAQQASLAPSRTKRAVHLLGRAEKGLSDEQYMEAARRILAAADLGGRPFLFVLHDDDGHFHLATVEVDEDGFAPARRLVSSSLKREVTSEEAGKLPPGDVSSRSWDSHLAWRLTKVARELEIEFDLRKLGKNRDTFDIVRIPTWQLKREAEHGIIPLAKALPDEMKVALDLPTWDERNEALAVLGLGIRPYEGANRKRRGLQIYALGDPTNFCKGSQLGKAYGLATIERRSDQSLQDWFRSKVVDRTAIIDVETTQSPIPVQPIKEDQALARLRGEYAQYRARHREARNQRRNRSKRMVADRHRDRAVVSALREQLLATGRVSKSWARIICQIVGSERRAKTAARHLREQADLAALPKRQLKWTEFLAEAAARDREAIRVHEQARRRADEEQKVRERALATQQAEAREKERRKSLEQAAAMEAAAQRASAELAERLRKAEERKVRDRHKELLIELEVKLIVRVRLASSEDQEAVLSFVSAWPEHRKAFTDPSLIAETKSLMKAVYEEQQQCLIDALKFVESIDDIGVFKGSRVDFDKIHDARSRSAMTVTFDWPEVLEAVQGRQTLLKSESATEPQTVPQVIAEPPALKPQVEPNAGARLQHVETVQNARPAEPLKDAEIAAGGSSLQNAEGTETFLGGKLKRAHRQLDRNIRDVVRQRASEQRERQGPPTVKKPLSVQPQFAAPSKTPAGPDTPRSAAEPDYIRVDREFAEAEVAAGRNVDGKKLTRWRDFMTSKEPVFYRPETDDIALVVDSDPEWVKAVSAGLNSSRDDDQIVRYLTLMVPLLPPASACPADTVSLPICSREDDSLAMLMAFANAASISRGR